MYPEIITFEINRHNYVEEAPKDPNIDNYEWFSIPGFRSYEINKYTKDIRSLKHYKKDCYHIMKIKDDGSTVIVSDYGKPTRVFPDDMYRLTFCEGHELKPRGDNERWCGAMCKVNRKMDSNLNILTGEYKPIEETVDKRKQLADEEHLFSPKIDENKIIIDYAPNFGLIKPFIIKKE